MYFSLISHFTFAVCFVDCLVAAGHLHLHKNATYLASCLANLIIREILPKILQGVYISWGVTDTRQFCFVIFVLRKWRKVTVSLVRIKNGALYMKGLIEIYLWVTNHMKWKSKGCRAAKSLFFYNDSLPTTTTSVQRPPLFNGHLSTTATSLQWPPLYSGHTSTVATSLQRPPLYISHLSTTATSLQRPLLYSGHVHLSTMTHRYDDHLSTIAISLHRPPLYNGHFSPMATSLQRPPLQWPPLYNGHLSTKREQVRRQESQYFY